MKISTIKFAPLVFICLIASCINSVPVCENCEFTCLDGTESDILTNDCLTDYECTFKILGDSEINIEESSGIGDGNKTVFEMITHTEGSPLIIDDEFTNTFIFELDASQESFSVENEELEAMNAHSRRICFCPNHDFYKLTQGCMQGEKQDDGTWFIQADLIQPEELGEVELKFELQFTQ